MSNIQDIEQSILKCWDISQDLDLIASEHENDDEICNKVLGVKHVYEMRFEKLWGEYELLVKEFYAMRNQLKEKTNELEL